MAVQAPLFVEERKEQILKTLDKQTKVLVPELCNQFGVSQVTIRNDLRELEAEGRLRRTHGGAIITDQKEQKPKVVTPATSNLYAKRRIARKAAEMVKDGDTIAIDIGSTALELAKCLIGKKELAIVTNDLHVAIQIEGSMPDAKIVLVGGVVRCGQHYTAGPIALKCLQWLNVDKAFIGSGGFSMERGFTTACLERAEVKRMMMELARETIIIADSSKAGKAVLVEFCTLKDVDKLITDSDLPEEMAYSVKQGAPGLKVIQA